MIKVGDLVVSCSKLRGIGIVVNVIPFSDTAATYTVWFPNASQNVIVKGSQEEHRKLFSWSINREDVGLALTKICEN